MLILAWLPIAALTYLAFVELTRPWIVVLTIGKIICFVTAGSALVNSLFRFRRFEMENKRRCFELYRLCIEDNVCGPVGLLIKLFLLENRPKDRGCVIPFEVASSRCEFVS